MLREIIESINESAKLNGREIKKLMSGLGAKLIGQTRKGGKFKGFTPEVHGNVIDVYEIGKLIVVLEKPSNDYYLKVFTEKPKPDMFTKMWNHDSQTTEGTKILKYSEKIKGYSVRRPKDYNPEELSKYINDNK